MTQMREQFSAKFFSQLLRSLKQLIWIRLIYFRLQLKVSKQLVNICYFKITDKLRREVFFRICNNI